MARRMTNSTAFYCRKSDVNKQGLAPILISISINGDRQYITTQFKAKPEDFEKAMASKRDHPIKSYVESLRLKLMDLQEQMMMDNVPLTAKGLKEYYQNGAVKKVITLGELFAEFLTIQKDRIDVKDGITKDTYNRYEKTTSMFLQANGMTNETFARDVTKEHAVKYKVWLSKYYDPATSCNYLQKIKSVFRYCFECGKIPSFPFQGFRIDRGQKDTVLFLTQEEVDKIRNYKFSTERLQKVADVFLFQCYTGLAYEDVANLEKSDFQRNDKGIVYIEKQRAKRTLSGNRGVTYCTVLMEDAISVAEKYDYQLPVNTNQKYNEYLKEVAALSGLTNSDGTVKRLTTHMARHTCCAYLLNHRNPVVPNETIIKVMGWTNEKQLRHYARIMNETVFDDLEGLTTSKKKKKQLVEPNVFPNKTKLVEPILPKAVEPKPVEKPDDGYDTIRTPDGRILRLKVHNK